MKEKLIYAKYSNERARRFAIRTDILEGPEGRYLRKTALYPEGRAHIRHLHRMYSLLDEQYRRIGCSANACRMEEEEGNAVILEYVDAESLEEQLDALIRRNRISEAEAGLKRFLDQVRFLHSQIEFTMTEEFQSVFGKRALPEGLRSAAVTNIDLLCQNLLMNETPVVIDYEWTFSFPIPCEFILYRIIHYYLCAGAVQKPLEEERLLREYGISPAFRQELERMEQSFQSYLLEGYVPLRELYSELTPGVQTFSLEEPLCGQIFFGHPGNYTEERSRRIPLKDHFLITELEIPKDCTALRIDPEDGPCLVRLQELEAGEGRPEPAALPTNGLYLGGNVFLFTEEDPWFQDIPVSRGCCRGKLCMEVMPLQAKAAEHLRKLTEELRASKTELHSLRGRLGQQQEEIERQQREIGERRKHIGQLEEANQEAARGIAGLQEQIRLLEEQLKQKNDQIEQMQNTKVWKLYEKYKNTVRR